MPSPARIYEPDKRRGKTDEPNDDNLAGTYTWSLRADDPRVQCPRRDCATALQQSATSGRRHASSRHRAPRTGHASPGAGHFRTRHRATRARHNHAAGTRHHHLFLRNPSGRNAL